MKISNIAAGVLVFMGFVSFAMADGMIVPIRPDVAVRGSWAVNYHHVDIIVRDQVASVSIDQEFVNTGTRAIEVEYFFPVPPHAAIDSMTLVVDGKEMAAVLMKADVARKLYEDIVRRKKDPALLEYAGFGLYRTRAFPLEPGKPARVQVHYNVICRKDHGLVEVWYPLNTEKFSAKPINDVLVRADIKEESTDVLSVYSPTHEITLDRKDPRHVIATYRGQNVLPAHDFQAFYKTSNDDVGATLLTHQPSADRDGYFMLLVSPNPSAGTGEVIAKDVVIVLDRSGSMSGQKIVQARQAVGFVLDNLNAGDRFNVIAYSDTIEPFFDGLVDWSEQNAAQARDRLDRITARGGTNIHDALLRAAGMFKTQADDQPARPGYVIFLTDGLPAVGKTDENTIIQSARQANRTGARVFAFGVGYDVNIRLLDKLVAENAGRSDYVRPDEPIETKVSSLYEKIRNPVMTDLSVRVEELRLVQTYPDQPGDLFEGDQMVIVGRYDSSGLTFGPDGSAQTVLFVSGTYAGQSRQFEYPVSIRSPGGEGRLAFVEQLWATRRVAFLLDQIQLHGESGELIDELVKLSLEYGIVTPYTSFLADENVKLTEQAELIHQAGRSVMALREYKGSAGQVGAMNRQALRMAERPVAQPTAPGLAYEMSGAADVASYEAGRRQTLSNVQIVDGQPLYRRGQLWMTPSTSQIDLDKPDQPIRRVQRFSEEYFELVRRNTQAQNSLLASQQPGEQLLIELDGDVYLIE